MKYYLLTLLFAATLTLTACERGPAESLGSDIDRAARDAGNAVEDLCEDILDAVDAARRNC